MKTKGKPVDLDKIIGANLRVARKECGMSQEALGKSAGVSLQQIQKYEKAINRIAASRLYQFSLVLKKPLTWFYRDPDGAEDHETLTGAKNISKILQENLSLTLFSIIEHNAASKPKPHHHNRDLMTAALTMEQANG